MAYISNRCKARRGGKRCVSGGPNLGPVYMRGGTGRLPGRDDARDPDMYMFLKFLSHTVYMEAGRFSSRLA